MLQVSINCFNVDLKFMQELVADRKLSDAELPEILQLGTCPLHPIHEAFCTAIKNTAWYVEKLLCVKWYLLHYSPAWHDDI